MKKYLFRVILSAAKNLALMGLVVGFFACGDDSGSTSASGENGSLSSAVEDDESSSSVNGDSSSSVIPGSSSSVILSDSEGSSSSVKGSDTADVSSSSVISDPDRESSSSSVKSSSSSAKSSSSVNSSSSVKSNSSSSVKSSSSVASSSSSTPMSSSEYIPYNHAGPLLADSLNSNAYQKFSDSRNGRSYYYLTINGKDGASVTVMAENLNIGEMVNGDKDQTNDSKIERYCYDNDTTKCDKYGGLYQWAEMMQLPSECNARSCASLIRPGHQGICPDGWRLLTYDDLVVILKADGNEHGIEGARAQGFGGYNTTGYSLVGAGLRRPTGEFKDCLGKETYWYYPGEILVDGEMFVLGSNTSYSDNSIYGPSNFNYTKLEGRSVRCVKVE